MDKRGWMMLRVLINRYNPKAGHALLNFLPQDELQAVKALDISSTDLSPILEQPQNSLARIHYSWIKPLLEHFPLRLQPVVLSALTPEQMTGLEAPTTQISSPLVKTFVLSQLYKHLKIDEHFPLEYLPETEFFPLANWSKPQIVQLVDFLGLHDLASEVRHIVNRDYLKNIYSCLNPKELSYLKKCLHQKEQLTSPKLGIDPAKQDCFKLKQVIHRRGLSRLGRALCGQHPDLIWHIAHTLDRGRGNILLKEYQPESVPKVTPILKQQVLSLINFLKSE